MSKITALSVCVILTCQLSAQQLIPSDYDFQSYKKQFPKESFIYLNLSNTDIIDFRQGELEISTIHEEKILCLDNNAFHLSKRSVGFDQFTTIDFIDAINYYPEKGRYKKEKIKDFEDQEAISSGISFYDDSKNRSFRFENLRKGSMVHLKYKKTLHEPRLLYRRMFSQQLFKKQQTYTLMVHKDINLGYKTFNLDSLSHEFKTYQKRKYKVFVWSVKDLEKKNTYGNSDYQLYTTPEIIPFIKSYQVDGKEIPIFRNLDDLYAWYASLIEQVKSTPDEELKKIADSLTSGLDTELEKVQAVYYWVQNQIKYIAFGDGYGGFVPRNPNQILDRRFGDCKDMSCLTISLLGEVGIKAYFSWVGTRMIPYGYSELYTPAVDNHMIATYIDPNGNEYFLDATNPNLGFGSPSSFIQGKEVLIGLDPDNYKLSKAPVVKAEKNTDYDSVQISLQNKKLIGNGMYVLTGYQAESGNAIIKKTAEEKLIKVHREILNKGSNKFNLLTFDYHRPNHSKDSLVINYDFEIEDYPNFVEDKMYLNLNLSKHFKRFKLDEKRTVPFLFDYLFRTKKRFIFKLPEAYELEFLPSTKTYDSKFFTYNISYTQSDSTIFYRFDFTQKMIRLDPEQIEEWNQELSTLTKSFDESIKLKKK